MRDNTDVEAVFPDVGTGVPDSKFATISTQVRCCSVDEKLICLHNGEAVENFVGVQQIDCFTSLMKVGRRREPTCSSDVECVQVDVSWLCIGVTIRRTHILPLDGRWIYTTVL